MLLSLLFKHKNYDGIFRNIIFLIIFLVIFIVINDIPDVIILRTTKLCINLAN